MRAAIILLLSVGVIHPVSGQSDIAFGTSKSVGDLLNADGTINLDAGFSGSLDISGYRMVLGSSGAPMFLPASASPNTWDNGFFLPGVDGDVNAIALIGGDLYIGGSFNAVDGVVANRIAKWDGTGWSALGSGGGNGVSSAVFALAVSGSDVYVGGFFASANVGADIIANNIAKWDGTGWSALGSGGGNGVSSTVRALAVSGSDVYVGGDFTSVNVGAAVTANRIAKWNGTGWSALGSGGGNGVDNYVYALAVSGSDVYVGGSFTSANAGVGVDVPANYIAKWNGTGWSALGSGGGNGVGSTVRALAVSGSDVYVVGDFTSVNVGAAITANRIAKWDGTGWSALGSGGGNGVNSTVYALAVSGSDVYVGGFFTSVNVGADIPANRIAKWDGTGWSALGSGGGNGVNSAVSALAVSGSDVYVGGSFTSVNVGADIPANRIAKWDGTGWSALGSGGGNGVNSTVFALAVSGSDVYVGGFFTSVNVGAADIIANNIAKWDGTGWSALGSGGGNGVDNYVFALGVSGSDVYVGGLFTSVNVGADITANRIAKWDGTGWSALGSGGGNGVNSTVFALAVSGSDVYVGGQFTSVNVGAAITANRIAKWDGTGWSALGSGGGNGVNNAVNALAVSGSDVYVGGEFTIANQGSSAAVVSSRIGRWFSNYASIPAAAVGGTVSSGEGTVSFNTTAVSMNLTTGGSGQFNIYRYNDSPVNVSGVTGNVSIYRWIIHQLGFGTSVSGEVRFKLDDIPGHGIDDPGTVLVYSRPTPGSGPFSALPTTYNVGTNELVAGVTGFSEFVIGSETDPLPVQIVSFAATADRLNAELKWRTESETENFGFEVERRKISQIHADTHGFESEDDGVVLTDNSRFTPARPASQDSATKRDSEERNQSGSEGGIHDSQQWVTIGFVPGAGTSSSPRDYSFVDKPNQPGRYAYRIKQIDHSGAFTYTASVEVEIGLAPKEFTLSQNYPNPFNPTTTIEFTLPEDGHVALRMYDVTGRELMTLLDEERPAGYYHQITIDASRFGSGSYFLRLEFGGQQLTRRIVLLK